jgi:tetratricopeptide (TPR) repeat protein
MTTDGWNTTAPGLLPFTQIVDRLPESCWHRRHADRFEQSCALLLEGDHTLDALDLDAPLANGAKLGDITLVLVTGRLTVTGAICNVDTDGAAALVVQGDLKAANMIVGGQEIYVGGNLEVEGLFWGDYNHGTMTVEGQTSAQFWLATDEYHCHLHGGIQVHGAHWDDDSHDAMPPPLCGATLLPWFPEALVCLDAEPDDSLNQWLRRERFVEAAREGRPVLVPHTPKSAFPPRLASGAITLANLQSLLQTSLSEGPARKNLVQLGTDPFFRLTFPSEDSLGSVYFETGSQRYFVTSVMTEPDSWSRVLGRKPTPTLVVEFTNDTGESPQWRNLSTAEIEAEPTLQAAWREWLAVVAEAEPVWQQLMHNVTVERIRALLDLPHVQTNFDDYRDDHEWGAYTLAVRQASEGTPKLSLGWMGSDQRDEDGDPEYCWAHFEIETTEDGLTRAAIDFQPATSGSPKIYDARLYLRRLPQIWNAFQAIEATLMAGQKAKALADARQTQDREVARRARWEAQVLPADGWLDVPLRQGVEHPPMQRFRLATPYEVREDIETLRFDGETVASIDHCLDDDEPSYFLVMDEDCTLPCLELDTTIDGIAIAGYLFRGSLTLESHLLEFDSDVSPLFVVKGDLSARNLSMGGNVFYVGGDLRCECLYGFYNHGNLVVAGTLSSDIVIAKDFNIRATALASRALLHADDIVSFNTVLDAQGNRFKRVDGFPCTCRVTDILSPELCSTVMYWQMYFPDAWSLEQRIRHGEQVIDPSLLDGLFVELPDALPQLFDWVFASPRLAQGKLLVRGGDNYDGEDFVFATMNEQGERSIGLNRGGGYNYQLFIRQDAEGAFHACHWVAPREGGEPAVMFSEPVASTRFSPMAAKHAFYVALERLAFLPYRGTLAPDASVESAISVQADIAALERYVGDDYEGKDTLAYHLHWLWPKAQAFYPPEAVEVTHLLEWNVVAHADSWGGRDRVVGYARASVQRASVFGHVLLHPDRFLQSLQVIAANQSGSDETLQLLDTAAECLVLQASVNALLETRRKRGYLLHELGRHEEARSFNRRLLADAEAQLGHDDAWLPPLLVNLAQNSYELEDLADAEACLCRTLDIGNRHHDSWAIDQALFQLGVLSHEQGRDDVARCYFEQRQEHAQSTGNKRLIAAAEESLAEWKQRSEQM